MSKRVGKAAPKVNVNEKPKKKKTGYKFPEHIAPGFVIQDTKKKEWKINETIGVGGFGEIYSACGANDTSKNPAYRYVVKVEPKENGPLFVEMHFYMKVAKIELVQEWKKKKGLKTFGMPVLHGSGSFEYKSNEYRFLVTDRLQKNVRLLLEQNNNKRFPHATVLQIGVQVLDTLQYIHENGYVHADIKADNLMLGMEPSTENTVYIIDFGMASKFTSSETELKNNPKKANNGTIEFISRDGHKGVFGFRSDLEILAYNLLLWMNGSLPWYGLTDLSVVENKKIELMKDPSSYIKKHMPNVTEEFIKFLQYINKMNNNDVPDYDYCRNLFVDKLKVLKSSPYGKLNFKFDECDNVKSPAKVPKQRGKKKAPNVEVPVQPSEDPLPKEGKTTRKRNVKNEDIQPNGVDKDEELSNVQKKPKSKGKEGENSALLNNEPSKKQKVTSKRNVKPNEVGTDKVVPTSQNEGKPKGKAGKSALLSNEPENLASKKRKALLRDDVKTNGVDNDEEAPTAEKQLKKEEDTVSSSNGSTESVSSLNSEEEHWLRKQQKNVKTKSPGVSNVNKKTPKGTSKPKKTESSESTTASSTSDEAITDKVTVRKRGAKKAAAVENKPSWRDAPTAIASNVKVAGEYVKTKPGSRRK